MSPRTPFVPAREAADRLGVRLPTLYAYVSRGLVRTTKKAADPRARLYAAADIDALLKRRARAKKPLAAAATALDWGLPVLETRLSKIENGRLFYRGSDAVELAATATLEQTAALLWGSEVVAFPRSAPRLPIAKSPRASDRAIARLAALLRDDIPAVAGSAALVRGAQLVRHIAEAASNANLPPGPLHAALAAAWRSDTAADAIRRALVLVADHELNASSFTARVVASTGASIGNCLVAGLAALSGPVHGGGTERVAAFLDEAERARSPEAAVAARLDRGEPIPGFGHPLYPDGDPRATALLAVPLVAGKNDVRLINAVANATGLRPNIDYALVTLQRGLALPRGAALALFATGRSVGWIAHALEQRQSGQLIRPRARYIADV